MENGEGKKMKILIVDQDRETRKKMEKWITDETKYQIVGEADNGVEGLSLIQEEQPDLVITEIELPKLNGLEMIHQAKERGASLNFVIVSEKEDFLYTRTAICYGVAEYLLKPLDRAEVQEMLRQIEKKLMVEKENNALLRESLIKGMLTNDRKVTKEKQKQLLEICNFKKNSGYTLIGMGVPAVPAAVIDHLFHKIHNSHKEYSFVQIYMEVERKYYCILEGSDVYGFLNQLRRYDQNDLLHGEQTVLAAEYIETIDKLSNAYDNLNKYYEYQMVFKQGCLLTKEKVSSYRGKDYSYPKAEENGLLKALIQMNPTLVMSYGNQFIRAIKAQHIYPYEIRHAYLKIFTAIGSLIQEFSPEMYKRIRLERTIQEVLTAASISQLESLFYRTLNQCLKRERREEAVDNSIILRAIAILRERYRDSITLNEVAAQLGVTPEYLSFLFTKEVGESFCSFLKKFRMSHAKRLLRFSNKKVYEISADLGYADSKYFSRVFKQEMGVTPAQYRQLEEI